MPIHDKSIGFIGGNYIQYLQLFTDYIPNLETQHPEDSDVFAGNRQNYSEILSCSITLLSGRRLASG